MELFLFVTGTLGVIIAANALTFLVSWEIIALSIELKFYVNAGLVLLGLSISFIVVLMRIGRVFLGAKNSNFDYFRPFATSAVPALLVICSLVLGVTSVIDLR